MRFQPLRSDRLDATFDDLLAFMAGIPASEYREMVGHALQRVHADLEIRWRPPVDEESWIGALAPALTTTPLADVLALIADPAQLKERTIALYEGVWKAVYEEACAAELPMLREAALRGASLSDRGFSEAYAALTGQRVPDVLERPPATFTQVAFCPSAHLGNFVSYIAYEPDLIVYFSAPRLLDRCRERDAAPSPPPIGDRSSISDQVDLLDAARALADPTRLRVLDLLLEGELYAQEIVGRLGVAQSAVSRHLSQLERAGLVTVEARRGSKYYAVNPDRFDALASALQERSARARARAS
jgi:DNA-binding transcriptional ArsR family regulator